MTIKMFIPEPSNPYNKSGLTQADCANFAPLGAQQEELGIAKRTGGIAEWIESLHALCGEDSDPHIVKMVEKILVKAADGGVITRGAQKFLRELSAKCSTDSDYIKFNDFIKQWQFVKYAQRALLTNKQPFSKEKYDRTITHVVSLRYTEEEAEWLVWSWADFHGIDVVDITQRENEVKEKEENVSKKEKEVETKEKDVVQREKDVKEKEKNVNGIIETAKTAASHDARKEYEELRKQADADVETAKKDADKKVKTAMEDADEKVKTAMEDADEKVKTAMEDAEEKVATAEKGKKEAEESRDKAFEIARKEYETLWDAAANERTKALSDQTESLKEKDHARQSVAEAERKERDAEQKAQIAIACADKSKRGEAEAKNSRRRIAISSAAVTVIAVAVTLFCLFLADSAIKNAANANAELTAYVQTFDDRLTTATERVDAREAEAKAARETADKALKDALAKQDAAVKAFAKAIDEQKITNAALVTAQNLEATANRKLAAATEKEDNAKEAKTRADTTMQVANETRVKAEQMMQVTVKKETEIDQKLLAGTQKANERVAIAEEKARMERERRMGVEAMLKAGAPLQFPLEDNERNTNARPQREVPSSPVSSSATPLPGYGNPATSPKRTVKEILSDVIWRWCLEKEFGIEDEAGELVGEVTGMQRTGYREYLQGSIPSDPGDGLSRYVGKFARRNLLAPTENTRGVWGDNDSSWSWEEWYAFQTPTDAMKEDIGVPPGHTFSLPKNEVPFHYAKLDRRFMLSQTEVTQELWEALMGSNPSHSKGAKQPVENVSWEECHDFIDKLNAMKKELGVPSGYEFTLPWQSEWEHACRAGTSTPYHFGLTSNGKQANHADINLYGTYEKGKQIDTTKKVGTYPANTWGLHDMHGNVWEWCQDGCGYGPLYVNGRSSLVDGFYRSLRGGSYQSLAEHCQSAYRSSGNPLVRHDDVGLRLCLAAVR